MMMTIPDDTYILDAIILQHYDNGDDNDDDDDDDVDDDDDDHDEFPQSSIFIGKPSQSKKLA